MPLAPPATHLIGWLGDETLFSLAARHHRIAGNSHPRATSQQLFGHARNFAHDFPGRLDEFVSRAGSWCGSAEELVFNRTLLGYYLRFRPQHDRLNAIAAARSGPGSWAKARLGILATRFGAAHPLKTCKQCMSLDNTFVSVAYWHLLQQCPGAWICLEHGIPLQYTSARVSGEMRFEWLLPQDCEFRSPFVALPSDKTLAMLLKFSECINGVARLPLEHGLEPSRLLATYQARMHRIELSKASGRVRTKALSERIAHVCQALRCVGELSRLPANPEEAEIQFARLVRDPRGTCPHPIRHFVLMISLFEDWQTFWDAYQQGSVVPAADALKADTTRSVFSGHPQKDQFLKLLMAGVSVSAAAKRCGVATATGIAWATDAGHKIKPRPSKLTSKSRTLAIERLRLGQPKALVATTLKASVSTINMLFKSEQGLRSAWHEAQKRKAQNQARTAWIRTAGKIADPSPKALRMLQPAAFAWLYRNDRAWLEAFAATLPAVPRRPSVGIRWDLRDRALAQQTKEAALRLATQDPSRHITIARLCAEIPTLKSRLGRLDELPLTRATILSISRRKTLSGLAF